MTQLCETTHFLTENSYFKNICAPFKKICSGSGNVLKISNPRSDTLNHSKTEFNSGQ